MLRGQLAEPSFGALSLLIFIAVVVVIAYLAYWIYTNMGLFEMLRDRDWATPLIVVGFLVIVGVLVLIGSI